MGRFQSSGHLLQELPTVHGQIYRGFQLSGDLSTNSERTHSMEDIICWDKSSYYFTVIFDDHQFCLPQHGCWEWPNCLLSWLKHLYLQGWRRHSLKSCPHHCAVSFWVHSLCGPYCVFREEKSRNTETTRVPEHWSPSWAYPLFGQPRIQ